MTTNGVILTTYHKKYPLLSRDFILPVHVGRKALGETKDGKITDEEYQWLLTNLIGDDSGENISNRNREYSECTGIYWFWKNYSFKSLDYVGVFQYRRQLILNDLFKKAKNDREKLVYNCIHLKKNANVCDVAGIDNSRIVEILSQYDYILPYRTSLDKVNIRSIYEDYSKIPGVHVQDIFILENVFRMKYPLFYEKLKEYLCSPKKLMYQLLIVKPQLFDNYCAWLFDLLFEIDPLIDSSLYLTNGKRTMGYLAEILYGFYFSYMISEDKAFRTGVTYLV